MATPKVVNSVSAKRKKNAINFSWKIPSTLTSQVYQFRIGKGKWSPKKAKSIGEKTKKVSIKFPASSKYPNKSSKCSSVSIKISGKRKDLKSAASVTKSFSIKKPNVPSVSVSVIGDPKAKFTWSVKNSGNTNNTWFSKVKWEAILVKNITSTNGSKQTWKVKGNTISYQKGSSTKASNSKSFTEDSGKIKDGNSYTRFFRVKAMGPAGDSKWKYAYHTYATPIRTTITSYTVNKSTTVSGYTISLKYNTPNSASRPIDKDIIEYAIATPDEGMRCPDNAGWKTGATIIPKSLKNNLKDKTSGALFTIDSMLGFDQCLFVRVNAQYGESIVYGVPKLIDVGTLKAPTNLVASVPDPETNKITISADNNSSVSDSFLAIRCFTETDQNGFDVGMIPKRSKSTIIDHPNTTENFDFGVYAIVGDPEHDPPYYLDNASFVTTTDITIKNNKTYYRTNESGEHVVVDDPNYCPTADTTIQSGKTYYEESPKDYVKTIDTEVDEEKTYYKLVDGEYVDVDNPKGNPSAKNWYVYVSTSYKLSDDTIVDANKSYYAKRGDEDFSKIDVPTGNPHANNYYEYVPYIAVILPRYIPTEDTEIVSGKTYYIEDEENPGTYEPVVMPFYILTEDTVVQPEKTYYYEDEENPGTYYPVVDPTGDPEEEGWYEVATNPEEAGWCEEVLNPSEQGWYDNVTNPSLYGYEEPSGSIRYVFYPRMLSEVTREGGDVPLAPKTVTAEPWETSGTVRVTWDWSWSDADAAEVSWADHRDAWESTKAPETYVVSKVRSGSLNINDLTTGIKWYIRVRLIKNNADTSVFGAYSDIVEVDLASNPIVPLINSISNDGIATEDGQVTVSWVYSTADGTEQDSAQIAEYVDGSYNPIDISIKSEKYVTLDIAQLGWKNGETHQIAIKVKSKSGRESDGYSVPQPIRIAEKPICFIKDASLELVNVTYEDEEGLTVTSKELSLTEFSAESPLTVNVSGVDTSSSATLIIERAEDFSAERPDETNYINFEGETIYINTLEGSGEFSITPEDAEDDDDSGLIGRFDDGARYRIRATVQDELGQSAQDTYIRMLTEDTEVEPDKSYYALSGTGEEDDPYIFTEVEDPDAEANPVQEGWYENYDSFGVNWAYQAKEPSAVVEIDEENMIAILTPIAPQGAEETDVCDIYRLSVDKPELIYEGATFGTTYVDPYPTIGEYGGHRFVTRTKNNDITTEDGFAMYDTPNDLDKSDVFETHTNIIDFDGQRALLLYEADISNSWSKDFKETKYLGGHVQGDWNAAVSRTGTLNATAVSDYDQSLIQIMRRLAEYDGICHVRSKDGSSYSADVQVSEDYEYTHAPRLNKYNLSITRVDPESLDGMTYAEWQKINEEESE